MKKTNSFFLIILLLGLFGCSNSVENTKQEISNLISSEFKVAEEKCLLEYTEDLCTSLYFTVDYPNDSNEVNIEMFKPEQSKVELLEVGTYSDISEWCSYIDKLITVNIGNFDLIRLNYANKSPYPKWDYLCALKDIYNQEIVTYDICESQTMMQIYRVLH